VGSLTSLFDVARSALASDQLALSVTSNNVANQNTVGYTRQVVSFSSLDSVTLSNSGGTGSSATVTASESSKRDRVLEQRVQQQTQTQASTSAESDVLSGIQNVFSLSTSSDTSGSTAIGAALDTFYSSLSSLASNPSDTTTRAAVLSAANSLAGAFNSASTQLSSIQNSINGTLGSSIQQVNALTSTIAQLNAQITASSPGQDAGTLEDQRQSAIAQLSQYVGLNQIQTESNGLTLTTTGGTVLVAGSQATALTAATSGNKTIIQNASGTDISAGVTGGSIGGQLQAQNTDLPAVQTALDAVAYRVATAVNAQNEAGVDASGNPGSAIFQVGSSTAGAAATISVIASGPSAVAAAAAGEGSLGSTNANALAALVNSTDSSGQTVDGQFGTLIGGIGSQAAALSEQNTTQSASLSQLTTQRDSISAVSLDDEAANLTQYQRSYEAAAKVLSVLDSLLGDALNLGQETTYST
jgi:flagellar hook-associated protein 1 FlgK